LQLFLERFPLRLALQRAQLLCCLLGLFRLELFRRVLLPQLLLVGVLVQLLFLLWVWLALAGRAQLQLLLEQ
jgi:hypothetical protein